MQYWQIIIYGQNFKMHGQMFTKLICILDRNVFNNALSANKNNCYSNAKKHYINKYIYYAFLFIFVFKCSLPFYYFFISLNNQLFFLFFNLHFLFWSKTKNLEALSPNHRVKQITRNACLKKHGKFFFLQ